VAGGSGAGGWPHGGSLQDALIETPCKTAGLNAVVSDAHKPRTHGGRELREALPMAGDLMAFGANLLKVLEPPCREEPSN